MSLRQNTAEGSASGTAVGPSQTGSGTVWDSVELVGSPTAVYDSSQHANGTQSYHITGASGDVARLRWSGYNDLTGAGRFYFRLNTLNTSAYLIAQLFNTATASPWAIGLTTAQKLYITDATGSTFHTYTGALSTGTWYRIEFQVNFGSSTSNGQCFTQLAVGNGSPIESSSDTTQNFAGPTAISYVKFGKLTSAVAQDTNFDDLAFNNGTTTGIGIPGTPPTAAFTSTPTGLSVAFNGSASVDSTGAPVSSYSWDFGDGNTGTGVSPTHVYASAGTYSVVLTVTDSGGNVDGQTNSVTVAAPASPAVPVSVNATGYTVTGGGTVLNAVTDANSATYLVSPTSGGAWSFTLAPLPVPLSGTDMTVTVQFDMTGATTGSTGTVSLMEGATTRATAAAQALTNVTSGTNMSHTLTFTFVAASIAAVTNWNALTVSGTATAS